jgi:nucleotide-binding universal stress UspA family protein
LGHLLVATDFSPNAGLALNWAIELAKDHGARITIVHAAGTIGLSPDDDRRRLDEAGKSASRWRIDVQTEQRSGKPWQVIAEFAARLKPDLIIMGTRGRTTLARIVMGTTADRVLRTAPVPVLVVHPDDDQLGRGFKTIVVPTDFSEEAARATSLARRLLAPVKDGGRLILMHVVELTIARGTLDPATIDPRHWDDLESEARQRMETNPGGAAAQRAHRS